MKRAMPTKHGIRASERGVTYWVGLLTGAAALLAGLFALEVHPISGTLIVLAAMALLLSAAAEFCRVGETHGPTLGTKRT
jgi:hypothetical protein